MKKTIFLFLALIGSFFVLQAQKDTVSLSKLQSYVRNIEVFNHLIPQEKVYLHFDNAGYVLGENIWFKAYVVNASQHVATGLSEVLYVELLNSKGKILETKKLKIEDGQTHGDFFLTPLNVEYFPGFYEIRAYTKNMLNFGEETVFSRVFPVFKEYKEDNGYKDSDLKDGLTIRLPEHREKKSKLKDVNITFYPEGGNLVNGLLSQVAFKVVDKEGNSVSVEGAVINSQKETLETFSTQHSGMGSFSYIPDGKKNQVKIFYQKKEYTFDLPSGISQGYVMTVSNYLKDALFLGIEKSSGFPSPLLGLSILCRGEVVYFQTVEFESSSIQIKIPKEQLPSGVNQIILFDEKGEVFAERLAFIYPENEEKITIKAYPDKEVYRGLEKVSIDLVAEGRDLPSGINFSLSIRDSEEIAGISNKDDIATYFLLSSDLQGYIDNPGYYFEDVDKSRLVALDLLMMVQGWKRYDWQKMAGTKLFEFVFEPERQLMIKGSLQTSSGKNAELKFKLDSGELEYMEDVVVSDEKGIFRIYPEDYYGEWTLTLRSQSIKEADKNIRLDRWFSPNPKQYSLSEMIWNSTPRVIDLEERNDLSPIEIVSIDSIKQLLLSEVTIRKTRSKDLVHDVGKDVDRMIDQGEWKSIPELVHDYLLLYDERYYKSELYFVSVRSASGRINNLFDNGNASESFFNNESGFQSLDATNEVIDYSQRGQHFGPEIEGSRMPKEVVPQFETVHSSGDLFEAQARKDNIHIRNLGTLETNGSFSYNHNLAWFFHLSEGKWDVLIEKALRTGEHIFDIRLQQYTARRKIQEVKKIEISQSLKSDENGTYFVPIYIYPFENFPMRTVSGVRYTTFEGYSKPGAFFSDYDYREDSLPDAFDHKRTIYWDPNVKMDKTGKVNISFYNNLTCRKIDISLEGITQEGVPVLKSE